MAASASASDATARELDGIKRLLILQLVRDGASQAEIASALGVAQSSISRMISAGSAPAGKARKGSSKR